VLSLKGMIKRPAGSTIRGETKNECIMSGWCDEGQFFACTSAVAIWRLCLGQFIPCQNLSTVHQAVDTLADKNKDIGWWWGKGYCPGPIVVGLLVVTVTFLC
jgi:hypothetical protein